MATPPMCTFICCLPIPFRPPLELGAGCLPGWLWGPCLVEEKGALSTAGRAHTWQELRDAQEWFWSGLMPAQPWDKNQSKLGLSITANGEPVVFKGNHVDHMERLWPQLASFRVSLGTWLLFTNGSQNDSNAGEGCRKACVPLLQRPCPTRKLSYLTFGKTKEACCFCWLVFLLHLRDLGRN